MHNNREIFAQLGTQTDTDKNWQQVKQVVVKGTGGNSPQVKLFSTRPKFVLSSFIIFSNKNTVMSYQNNSIQFQQQQ